MAGIKDLRIFVGIVMALGMVLGFLALGLPAVFAVPGWFVTTGLIGLAVAGVVLGIDRFLINIAE